MKRSQLGWLVLSISFLLTGCELLLQAGTIPYPKAYPYLQHLGKPGMTPEGRRQDSKSCGAGDTDHVGFNNAKRLKADQRPSETEIQTEDRLREEWRKCMRAKGYEWITTPK